MPISLQKFQERGDTMSREKADYRLTEKQKRFAEEYLIDCNGTRAYKAAYPSCKKDSSADANARKLLGNARIRAYIDYRLEEIHSAKTADAQEVIEYLTAVMRGEQREQTLRLIGDGIQTITDIDVSAKERLKAAELLGKRFGLFTEKVKVDVSPVTIIDDIPKEEDADV